MRKGFSRAPKRKDNNGFASGIERNVNEQLKKSGLDFHYEDDECKFIYNKKLRLGKCNTCDSHDVVEQHVYTCDFKFISKSGKEIWVEIKGHPLAWKAETRAKHIAIKEQYPDRDLRFVFTDKEAKIKKGAKTTNSQWCKQKGFKCASRLIPKAWLEE
jgi:hypothetical protein